MTHSILDRLRRYDLEKKDYINEVCLFFQRLLDTGCNQKELEKIFTEVKKKYKI